MKRRRHPARPEQNTPQSIKSATSPETRLRRSKRATSPTTPAKLSRLQPSEPLHMTTRAASRAASQATNSAAGSVASADSRRSSLAEASQQDAHYDTENDRPAKRSRVSTETDSPPDAVFQSPVGSVQPAEDLKPASRASSNERKRSTNGSRLSDASNDSDQIDHSVNSASSVNSGPNGALLKKSESDLSEKQPPITRRGRRPKVASTEPPLDSTEAPPELTDATTAPGSPEPNLENAITQDLQNVLPTTSQEPAKTVKRLPGRRRQPHSDINIEADLRRQLQLKTAYRSVVKALKPILGELADRTITGLENEPDFHKQSDQYHVVSTQLNNGLKQRLAVLNHTREEKLACLDRIRDAEEQIQRKQFELTVRNLQEDFFLKCLHRLLQLDREAKGHDGVGTDDEDFVVPPRHGVQYPDKSTGPLPAKFDSRSRAFIETKRMWKEAERRRALEKERKEFLKENADYDDSIENLPGGFAAFTGPDREYADASYNVGTLVKAAKLVERAAAEKARIKVIPNAEATALLMLASLSEEAPPATPVEKKGKGKKPAASTTTTPRKAGGIPPTSPYGPPSATSTAMSLETANSSPAKQAETAEIPAQPLPTTDTNGVVAPSGNEVIKSEVPVKSYSNKITDLLNNEHDDPGQRMRAMRPTALSYDSQPPTSAPANVDPSTQSSLNGTLRRDFTDDRGQEERYGHPAEQKPVATSTEVGRPPERPPLGTQFWVNSRLNDQRGSRDMTPEKAPIYSRVRQMLDSTRGATPDRTPDRAGSESASDTSNARRGSTEKPHMGPPPSRVTIPHERSGSCSRRLSGGHNAVSPSTGHLTISQPPVDQHAQHGQHGRPTSMDHGHRSPWEDNRRSSGPGTAAPQHAPQAHPQPTHPSQAHPPPVSPYGPPPQGYAPDYNGQARPPPQPGPQLPPFVQPQPPPPPYRYQFAHYDSQGPPPAPYPVPSPVSGNYGPPPPHQQGPPQHQQGPPQHQQGPPQHQQGPPSHQHGPPPHQQGPSPHHQGPPHQQGPPQHQQ
ncbi:hypothetical protein AOQ84DRAFT_384632, partial [Glonium stellatum]